jgi:signal peptidase II
MANRVSMLKWLGVSAAVIALDWVTKRWIEAALAYGDHRPVTSFFDLVLFHNEGAAFSFLAAAGGWQRLFFSGVAVVASVIILRLMVRHPEKKLFCFALGLILGGAIGNLFDRILLGHVVDFLFFHYQHWYWPAFNVADSAICCGVILLLWEELKKPSADKH